MEEQISTFEYLVTTLSSEEVKKLLNNIKVSIERHVQDTQNQKEKEEPDAEKELPKNALSTSLAKESLFLRLWLTFISFIKSISLESLYQKELIKRIGYSLKEVATEYVDVQNKQYKKPFFDLLFNLRKTQLFFSGVLDCYNAEKSSFYMILLSFISNKLYKTLLQKTSVFDKDEKDVSTSKKNAILKEVESLSGELDVEIKTEMYRVAKAIEWMRTFCDFSLDKMLAKFSLQSNGERASMQVLQNEVELLASILASSKEVPISMLQTLFLLQQKDSFLPNKNNVEQVENEQIAKNVQKFIDDGLTSLSYIEDFKKKIPLYKIVRYVKQDITWTPLEFRGGEDWFLYFKHAWKDFFLQKWMEWSQEIQKTKTMQKVLDILGQESLDSLSYKPWRALLGSSLLKNERLLEFFKTFFNKSYGEDVAPYIKTLLVEGSFYRTSTLAELTALNALLNNIPNDILNLEKELSPEGVIGTSFVSITESGVLTIKTKAQVESLIKNIEGEFKRLINKILEALPSLKNILSAILGEGKGGDHAVLTNWASIEGSQHEAFQKKISSIKDMLESTISLSSQISLYY